MKVGGVVKLLAVPAVVVGYVTIAGLTGFCPTCEQIVNGVTGAGSCSSGSCAAPAPAMAGGADAGALTIREVAAADARTGEEVLLSDVLAAHAGQPMLIDVWGTYCPPCRKMRGVLAEGSEALKDVTVVAVAVDRPDALQAYLDAHEPVGIELRATAQTLDALGGVESIPTLFLVDGEGVIRERMVGVHSAVELASALSALR